MPWSNARPKYNTVARGYGASHKKLRAHWATLVATGGVNCWRCHRPILPGSKWHLGHADWDRSVTKGPECVDCNLRAAAKKGRLVQKIRKQPKRVIVDRW